MSTVQNILNRTSVVAEAARSTSTGTGFDAVLAGAIRDDRSATVDRRSQQPGREPVRAEQPDRARADRTDRSDRSSRPDRADRPRTEKADRPDRTNKSRTDRSEQTDRPATTDDTVPTDQKATQAAVAGTAAPTVTPILTDPNALVVATPVEALPALPVPSEATIAAESDLVVATVPEVASGPDTVPALPATTVAPVEEPATPQPATAQTTTVPTAAATAVPAETTAPVTESVKSTPANAGPQPAAAPAPAAQATGQVTAQSATPAATESTSPATSTPAAPTTPVAPAVQVGSVALPTTAVTRESAAPLSDQLAGKLAEQLPGLKAAGPGRHTLSLTVTPEHFGKIQVVAHISAESVRVELVGATDAARDSLRAALPDLRRDLAQSGLSSDVRLGDPNAGTDPRGGQPGLSDSSRRPTGTGTTPGTVPGDQSTPAPESVPVRTASAAGGLDLLV